MTRSRNLNPIRRRAVAAIGSAMVLCAITVMYLAPGCSRPTGPTPFVRIQLEIVGRPDSTSYVGVPIEISAVLDSAVPFGEIQWYTGRGIQKRRRLSATDTTRVDTIWLTWDELPAMPIFKDTALLEELPEYPEDTIWADFRGSVSNKVRVAVVNRPPKLDSIIVNGRNTPILEDSITIAGNHSTIAYCTLYVSDADSGAALDVEWLQQDTLGKIVNPLKGVNVSGALGAAGISQKWPILWQAPDVGEVGDTTLTTTAVIKVTDRERGIMEVNVRLVVYRESGSIWLASTQENTSTLIKYSDNGEELFRVPGFGEINSMAVSPKREVVWLTDRDVGKVYCLDDDGNVVYGISGFTQPSAIDVHDELGFCYVADLDTASGPTNMMSQIRKVNREGNGKVDSLTQQLRIQGHISMVKIDQRLEDRIFFLNIHGDSSSTYLFRVDNEVSRGRIAGFTKPLSLDLNPLIDAVWIVDTDNNRVVRMSMETGVVDSIKSIVNGFLRPRAVAINLADSSCWVADTDNNRVIKLLPGVPDGYDLNIGTDYHVEVDAVRGINFKQPIALAVNSHENGGVVWVADTQNNRIVKLDSDGNAILSITEYGMESSAFIAVNTGTK